MAVEVGMAERALMDCMAEVVGMADMVDGTVVRAVMDGMGVEVGMGITTHGISFTST